MISLHRYSDYDIDYDKGRIYFKNPVHRNNNEFDPQYIVVKYEMDGNGGDNYTYGGRAAIKSSDGKYELGASYISEDNGEFRNRLMGADVLLKIDRETEFKAEYAQSNNHDINGSHKATAKLAQLEHRDNNTTWRLYYREQDENFGLGQLSSELGGTRKVGLDASSRYGENWETRVSVYQNRRYGTYGDNSKENVAQADVTYRDNNYSISLGTRHAKGAGTKATNQIIARVEKSMLEKKLRIWAQQEQSIGSNEDSEFPTRTELGAEYSYDDNVSVHAVLERLDRDGEISWQSRMGATYKTWGDTELKFDRVYESGIDRSRAHDVFGVFKEWKQSKQLTIKVGYEKAIEESSDTLTDANEYDAYNLGYRYEGDKYSSRLELEYRDGNIEDKLNVDAGIYIEKSKSVGLAFGVGYHKWWGDTIDSREIDAKLAYVYRPLDGKWVVLDRFDYKLTDDSDEQSSSEKFINNLHINYEMDDRWQFALQYGLKYVIDEFDGMSYDGWVDLLGADVRYDIDERWTVGVQGSVLHTYDADNYEYGIGAFVDTSIWDNTTLRIGYNIRGLGDDDFKAKNYYRDGIYMMFRVKFDQETLRNLAGDI